MHSKLTIDLAVGKARISNLTDAHRILTIALHRPHHHWLECSWTVGLRYATIWVGVSVHTISVAKIFRFSAISRSMSPLNRSGVLGIGVIAAALDEVYQQLHDLLRS